MSPSMIYGWPLNEYFSREEESSCIDAPAAASQKKRVAELVGVLRQALEGKPSKRTDVEILSNVRESDMHITIIPKALLPTPVSSTAYTHDSSLNATSPDQPANASFFPLQTLTLTLCERRCRLPFERQPPLSLPPPFSRCISESSR